MLHFTYLNDLVGVPSVNVAYWTLAIECQWYILVGLMLPLLASSRKRVRFAAVAAMMAAFFAFPNQHLVFSRLPIFLVGVFVFQYRSRLIGLYEMLGLILAMVVAMFWPIGLIVASVSVATGLIIALSTFHNRAADFVGDISYSLYLLHLPIGVAVIGCLSHWLPYSSSYIGVLDVVGLVASGLAAWIMYQLIEKPSQVMSSAIRFAHRAVESPPAAVAAAGRGFHEYKRSTGLRLVSSGFARGLHHRFLHTVFAGPIQADLVSIGIVEISMAPAPRHHARQLGDVKTLLLELTAETHRGRGLQSTGPRPRWQWGHPARPDAAR